MCPRFGRLLYIATSSLVPAGLDTYTSSAGKVVRTIDGKQKPTTLFNIGVTRMRRHCHLYVVHYSMEAIIGHY